MEQKYKNKRCVPGCNNEGSKRHRFPKNPEMCKRWVDNINAPDLKDLTPNHIYWHFCVCEIHFAQEYLVPDTLRGLRKDAIPTLNLSGELFVITNVGSYNHGFGVFVVISEEVEAIIEYKCEHLKQVTECEDINLQPSTFTASASSIEISLEA